MSLTKAQLEQRLKELETQLATQQSGLTVKKNIKGGIFIRHGSFKEWSTKLNKEYTASLNLPFNTAKTLFNNQALIDQIRDLINGIE